MNAVTIVLIDHIEPPANAYGDAPFRVRGDFATPNEAYFRHADWVIRRAGEKGMVVLLSPCYLGSQGGDEGFYQDVVRNGAAKMREWGRFVGSRYRGYDNIIWLDGGDYDPRRHRIVSGASCTTTCLAHMMRPLIDTLGAKRILSASMATVHAATGSQEVLDRLPEAGKGDLRKSRSVLNNIILTSTGAANALRFVIPEMQAIPFIAESVRIPVSTGSLISPFMLTAS